MKRSAPATSAMGEKKTKRPHVEIPKPPRQLTAYMMYMKMQLPEAKKAQPSMGLTELSKSMADIWERFDDSHKEPFKQEAQRANARAQEDWDSGKPGRDAKRRRLCKQWDIPTTCSWQQLLDHSQGRGRYAEQERLRQQQREQARAQQAQRAKDKQRKQAAIAKTGEHQKLHMSVTSPHLPSSSTPSSTPRDSSPATVPHSSTGSTERSFSNRKSAKRLRGTSKGTAGSSIPDSWRGCWRPVKRKAAITKAVDRIFQMAQKHENFELFGNDVIQCFYDLATIADEPVRSRCLKYVEQVAHRWKHNVVARGWRKGGQTGEATPQEVIDAVIGMYCLERLGIHHKLKAEVLAYICSGGSASAGPGHSQMSSSVNSSARSAVKQCADSKASNGGDAAGNHEVDVPSPAATNSSTVRKPFGVVDYLRWDPSAVDRPPSNIIDPADGVTTLTPYRVLSNALIYTFYANRVGVVLGEPYEVFFKHVAALRPYSGPRELGWTAYEDQCYLITHIIFTLTNWGELRIDPELMPHEYLFVREHLAVFIGREDVHLVGEFVECLRAFGADDSDVLIRQGLAFLLESQDADGRWDAGNDKDAYTCYHATMCAAQALVHHNYRGFGPGILEVTPMLMQWHEAELAAGRAAHREQKEREEAEEQEDTTYSAAPTASIDTVRSMLQPLEAASLFAESALERSQAASEANASIEQLRGLHWTIELLKESGAVDALKAVRDKCKDTAVAASAKALVKTWRKAFKNK